MNVTQTEKKTLFTLTKQAKHCQSQVSPTGKKSLFTSSGYSKCNFAKMVDTSMKKNTVNTPIGSVWIIIVL